MELFFDLTKAFDMVDHGLLLHKLDCLGIRGVSHSWVSSYLQGRTQTVQISFKDSHGLQRTASSNSSVVVKGVPQGSVLGPILFILFVNDLPSCVAGVNAKVSLFADDTSLSLRAKTPAELETVAFSETSSLMQWFQRNLLLLNSAKTQVLEFHIGNGSRQSGISNLFWEKKRSQSVEFQSFSVCTLITS